MNAAVLLAGGIVDQFQVEGLDLHFLKMLRKH